MSLITRCPACGTMFNVVPDQLKVSQGWVRCGQCAVVFDASLYLQPDNTLQKSVPDQHAKPEFHPLPPTPGGCVDVSQQAAGLTLSDSPDSSYVEEVSAALNTADTPLVAKASADPAAEPESGDKPGSAEDLTGAATEDVSFVRDARRQAFWRRPVVRVVLACAALLLMVVLVLQLAVQKRDTLSVLEPRLKPVLQDICDLFSCTVGPARQIEAIVIDSSSFNKVNESVYRLSFSIKSSAPTVVAMPSLEVTLTDTQDQTVIRRVLMPGQFGQASGTLDANAEFSGAVTLQLTPVEAGSPAARRVAGYRLLAFYP